MQCKPDRRRDERVGVRLGPRIEQHEIDGTPSEQKLRRARQVELPYGPGAKGPGDERRGNADARLAPGGTMTAAELQQRKELRPFGRMTDIMRRNQHSW